MQNASKCNRFHKKPAFSSKMLKNLPEKSENAFFLRKKIIDELFRIAKIRKAKGFPV